MTDLLTLATSDDLTPLGTLDGVDYHELRLVVGRDPSGALTPICTMGTWPDTLIARLIHARAVIVSQQEQLQTLARQAAEGEDARDALARLTPVATATSEAANVLRLRLAEAERRVAELSAGSVTEGGRRLYESGAPRVTETPAPGGPMVCQECGASFASPRALTTHHNRKHRGKTPQDRGLYECGVCHKHKPITGYYSELDEATGRRVRIRTTCRACTAQSSKRRPLSKREPGELDCPECLAEGKLPFKPVFNRRNLNQHRRYAHGVIGTQTKLKAPAQIAPAEDAAPGWRCKQCGVDAMPDRHYDEFCVTCASAPTELAA